jgi:hypothetical protein
MRIKVLSLALLAALIALPVPASQWLTGTPSAPASAATIEPGNGSLALLLEDPFLVDRMSFSPPRSFTDI